MERCTANIEHVPALILFCLVPRGHIGEFFVEIPVLVTARPKEVARILALSAKLFRIANRSQLSAYNG